jgi:hypothetical protein
VFIRLNNDRIVPFNRILAVDPLITSLDLSLMVLGSTAPMPFPLAHCSTLAALI